MKVPSANALFSLVGRAHQRAMLQLTLDQTLLAVSAALLGLACLLALGTQWFPVLLVLAFSIAGIAIAAYRWTQLRPNPYQVAQQLDARWATCDQISTAYYFRNELEGNTIVQLQNRLAAEASAGDLSSALPFRIPKTAFPAAALLLLTLSLFAVRQSGQAGLSLTPPTAPLSFLSATPNDNTGETESAAPEEKQKGDDPARSLTDPAALAARGQEDWPETIPVASPENESGDAEASEDAAPPVAEGLSSEEYGDPLTAADGAQGSEDAESQETEGPGESSSPSENAQAPEAPKGSRMGEESGDLLSRLKDAFENMLDALKGEESGSPAENGKQPANPSSQPPGETAEAQPKEGQPGGKEAGGEGQPEEGAGATAESLQESAQAGAGTQGSEAGNQQPNVAAAGTADGSKELQEAARLEAMGEINRLYQQRAEEIRGQVLIETDKAKHDLQTPYQPSDAQHRNSGGAASRDEVPLAYRTFIQTYFDNLKQSDKD